MSVGFAKKIGMTRLFIENKAVPVTVLQFQKSVVTQVKTKQKEGYDSIQVSAMPQKKVTKAVLGHIQKALPEVVSGFRKVSEFKKVITDQTEFSINDFIVGNLLSITNKTIGRGYTGAVKRWGFAGQPQTHGHDHTRAVGSMGSRWPQRVVKGKKMAGQHGNQNLTLNNVKIVAIDEELNLIFINGSIPGANSSIVKLQKTKDAK